MDAMFANLKLFDLVFAMDLHWKDVDGSTTHFKEVQRHIGGQCQRREKLSLSQ